MTEKEPYVITVSRQLGSGGAFLGQQLASRLKITYMDREILREAAKRLNSSEEMLECRDETVTPFWQCIMQGFSYGTPEIPYTPPSTLPLSDEELFEVETEIIEKIPQETSAVIVGRGGYHILRDQPRHLSIFLHAKSDFRIKRVQEIYHVPESQAREMVERTDHDRARYLRTLTGKDWTDARQYHLSFDTGILGLDAAEEIVMTCLRTRFGIE